MRTEQSKLDCPLCGEHLLKNIEGKMTLKSLSIDVYLCEECNQSFAYDIGQIKLIPFDAQMKKIENKCKVCETIRNFNQQGIFMLNINTAYYEFHCLDCAKKILQVWAKENCKKDLKIDDENIQQIADLYDFNKNNEMLIEMNKNPEKYKNTMDKIQKEFVLSEETEVKE